MGALELTGKSTWDEVFQQYLAKPLKVNSNRCQFSFPDEGAGLAGGGLVCDTTSMGKMLQAILKKSFLANKDLFDEAERVHTTGVELGPTGPGLLWQSCNQAAVELGCNATAMPLFDSEDVPYLHYGLGQWIECGTPSCEGSSLWTSSVGLMGSYPWIDRGANTGRKPHWGIIVRNFPNANLVRVIQELLPRAAAVVK